MQSIPKSPLLEWPPNALQDIRKLLNLDKPGRIEDAIAILEEWIQKQDHFMKKDFSRDYLERCLISSKGSVEKSKKQIDRLCTLKTLLPQFFTKQNIREDLMDAFDLACISPLPKLTNDFYRIYFVKDNGKQLSDDLMLAYLKYNICIAEYLKANDYANGFIIVHDCQKTNFGDLLTKVNPIMLQQYLIIIMDGFGARLKGLHILTQSKVVDLFVKMFKKFLNQKIADRFFVHKTLDEMFTVVPKDLLPSNYGGNEKSIETLSSDWIENICSEENVEYIKMMSEACTNEQLRCTDKFNNEYMGMPGSFRNLKVD